MLYYGNLAYIWW